VQTRRVAADRAEESIVLADYSRDLPQFAAEWGIELTNKGKYDITQQLQRTVKRLQQELKRMIARDGGDNGDG